MNVRNNKGFAVSTLLYGLSIMGFLIVILLMSIMSSNRTNTSDFVKQIEDDLNRYSLTESTIRTTSEASGTQEYFVPFGQAGWYKIELWGASGGSKGSYQGGKGAYTSGIIYLEENTHLYFYIGTKGTSSGGGKNNGGGATGTIAGGGGATDVRIQSGDYTEDNSMKTRIMVAAGGGGATTSSAGGKGGELKGYKGNGTVGSALQTCTSFAANAGSGGGFCNGASSEGGSSYISGYAGSSSWALNLDYTNYSSSFNRNDTAVSLKYAFVTYNEDGDPNGYIEPDKGFGFVNGVMISGVNDGDGKAKIERVNLVSKDQVLAKKVGLDSIKKIVDCVDNATGTWAEIQAITNRNNKMGGVNIVPTNGTITTSPDTANKNNAKDGNLSTSATVTTSATMKCLTVTFDANYNLDEIAVWHKVGNIAKHSLKACHSSDDSNCVTLSEYNGIDNDPIVETANGLHYSAYSTNPSANPMNGVYYIIPASNTSVVLKTGNSILGQDMTVTGASLDGTNYQKWQLTNETGNTYVALEAQNYNSMQINGIGSNAGDSIIGGPRLAGGSNREKWIITPTKNGLYTISSPLGTKAIYSGNNLITANNSANGQNTKFYIINSDY